MPQAPKLQPAIYGGLFIGVLTALPFVNFCCCLWMIAGGAIAVYLMQQNHLYPVNAADGALVGLLAGIFGAIISGLLSIPINMVFAPLVQRMMGLVINNPEFSQEAKSTLENMMARNAEFSVARTIAGIGIGMVVGSVFGLLGGLLGVAVFKKEGPPPPPPGTIDVYPPPPISTPPFSAPPPPPPAGNP
jgi:hypothetical protein